MKKLIGLDILKIISMIIIFLFHSHIHCNINFGLFNEYLSVGAIYMTLFFILSGCTIFYSNKDKNLTEANELKKYFIKRFFSIIPLYYLTSIIYVVTIGKETFFQNILLFPIESLGLQSLFYNTFELSHNDGTWFISCILICYFLFPYIQLLLKNLNKKEQKILFFLCIIILLIAPLEVKYFSLGTIYYNPFIRLLEFLVGAIIISINNDIKTSKLIKLLSNKILFFLEMILLYLIITFLVKKGFELYDYTAYSSIALPFFIIITITILNIEFKKLNNSKCINFLSNIAYPFFLSQFWCFKLTNNLFDINTPNSNLLSLYKLIVSLTFCFIISIILYELFQKTIIKKISNKYLVKK